MAGRDNSTSNRKLDLAARAAWLYYIRGRTQDEIATELNVSRQNAQRLIALATSEGLIKFRMDYPITECVEMAERLKDRFGLVFCDIIPGERRDEAPVAGIAISAAERIESYLSSKAPAVWRWEPGERYGPPWRRSLRWSGPSTRSFRSSAT